MPQKLIWREASPEKLVGKDQKTYANVVMDFYSQSVGKQLHLHFENTQR